MSSDVFEYSLHASDDGCNRYEESDRRGFGTYLCRALTGIIERGCREGRRNVVFRVWSYSLANVVHPAWRSPTRNHLDASLEAIVWRIGTLSHRIACRGSGWAPTLTLRWRASMARQEGVDADDRQNEKLHISW